MDYRFYQRILENSWIFIKKHRDTLYTKHFQNSIVYFFSFLVFLTSFSLFYPSMVFTKIVQFLCCFIVWIRDFIKKLRYLKSKISTKFHRLLFLFYFFSIFGIFFAISRTQTCAKIMEIFVVFYWKGSRFYQQFLEISKSSFKKNIDMWNMFFFSKFCDLLFVFLFFLFLTFIFNFVYLYLSKNAAKFLCFVILWIRDFMKEFLKIMEYFSKKYRHLKS